MSGISTSIWALVGSGDGRHSSPYPSRVSIVWGSWVRTNQGSGTERELCPHCSDKLKEREAVLVTVTL